MPDTVGNTLATAKSINLIASPQTFSEFIGVENGVLDSSDYYRFTLARSSSFTLQLGGLSADANVEVLDNTGAVVTDSNGITLRSTNSGTLPEAFSSILNAGTYYIHVFPGPATNPLDPIATTPSTTYALNVAANDNTRSDIFWRNSISGENSVWNMDGTTFVSSATVNALDPSWVVQALGDMDGDADTDIVWRNTITGNAGIWIMNGTAFVSAVAVTPTISTLDWKIVGIGDFNKDGKNDLVWQNNVTNQVGVWYMNGPVFTGSTALLDSPSNNNMRIQGIADFNNDGNVDILFRDYTPGGLGYNTVWLMNGVNRLSTESLPFLSNLDYQIIGTGDYNLDGKPDIVFRNVVSGENSLWFLNGTSFASSAVLTTLNKDYQGIVPFKRFLSPTRVDLAGNNITANPFSIGPLNGSGFYNDFVGGTDSNDYYRFFLGSTTELNLTLSGPNGSNPTGDLDVQILDAAGNIVLINANPVQSVNSGTVPESIVTNLNPGNYFIRIFPKTNTDSSFYQLALNVNNLPVLATKSNLTLNEGGTQTIGSSLLLVTDENNSADQLTYTLVNPPGRGNLSLNGAAIIAGSTFTQANINTGKLSFTQDGSETLVDNFVFSVSDGAGGTISNSTYTINVTPVNDPPSLVSNQALTLVEGQAAALTSSALLVTDVEQAASSVIYSLNSLPANGKLLLNGSTLATGATFTQADLDSGTKLTYTHNGSETTSDSFTFTVTDGAGGTLLPAPTVFNINVTPFNDAPVLTTNLGLTVSQDATSRIASTLLTATDAEFLTLPDQVVYTVVTGPTRGTLYRDGTVTSTFTQADLNNGTVSYDHDGSNTNSDSFTFRISDGVNIVPDASLAPSVFNITVNRSNFVPVLATNTGLTLNEGATSNISNALLQITDQDNPPPQLVYTLQSVPTRGSLKRFGTALTVGQTFTQDDIDNLGRIAYQHDGSETLTDTFSFTASDGSNNIPISTFSISVTPVNDAPVLVSNSGATLSEGGSFLITNTTLLVTDNENPPPASLIYSISSAPTSGTLLLGATPVNTFTQADVNSGQLRYSHNGSESVADSFSFTITDGVISTPIAGNNFNIAIAPVNDAPRVSLNTGLTLSEGTSSTINSTELLVTDLDGPGGVTYTLGTQAARGTLLLGTAPLTTGQTFTQADIAAGQLTYQHNGSETLSDSFTFTASDGLAASLPLTTFSINVLPVNDAPAITIPGAQTVNEDTQLTFANATRISLTDAENDNPISVQLAVTSGIITVNSGAGVLNNNTSNVTVTGSVVAVNTALNSLIYKPVANFNGPDELIVSATDGTDTTVGTVNITVAAVNDAPTLTVPTAAQIVNEDTPIVLTTIDTTDIDSGGSPVSATLSANNGTLSLASIAGVSFINGANGSNSLSIVGTIDSIRTVLSNIAYQGNPDYNGSDTITVTVNDLGNTGAAGPLSVTRTIPVTVRSVNDAPTFNGGPSQIVNEDAGTQTIAGWATDISRGPANESTQSLNFVVSNSNPNLFTTAGQPTINPTTGELTYTPATNAFGSATVNVTLQDNGGTAFGGNDTSSPYNFTITVNPVNDAPTFTKGPNITVTEDAPAQSVLWATNISPGPGTPLPPNESNQTVSFIVDNSNPNLFTTAGQPAIASNGTLSYALAQDANGIAVITVRLRDSGGTDNGGVDTSAFQTFTINATAVNDAPTLTLPGTLSVDEDAVLGIPGVSINDVDSGSGSLRITLSALGPSGASTGGNLSFNATPGVVITGNNSNSLTLTGKLDDLNAALTTFNYQGKPNINGQDRVVITVNDQGNSPSGPLSATQTLTVNITPVNDAPILNITGGTIRSGSEDGLITLSGISVTDVDSDPGNVQVTVSVLQGTLTASAAGTPPAAVSGAGSIITLTGTRSSVNSTLNTLRYQGNPDYNGSDEATVTVNDLGNTGIGGALTDTKTLSINVTPVNDPPTFISFPTGTLSVAEDTDLLFSGASAIVVTDVDSGLNPVRLTLSVNNGTLNLSTAGLTTVSGANGTKSATYDGTIDAIANALSTLIYKGNLNFNGADRLTLSINDNGFTGSATGTPITRTLDLTVTPVNDPPVLVTNNALTLNEGANQSISNGLLRTTDVDNPANQVVYTLSAGSAPLNGSLVLGSTTLGAGSIFTQDDINLGRVRYFHNGSETTSDSFVFVVNDGGASPTTATFNVVVNPLNDAPVLANRQTLLVTEGQSGTISTSLLSVTDPDNTPPQLRYTVTNLPTSGNVRLNGSNLTVGQSFTQNDINLSRVTYRHNGSETASDSFTFTVSDGAGGNIGSTVFNINVSPVDDAPIVVSNGPLTTSEGAITTITRSALQTSDPESQPLTYTLIAQPLFGSLTLGGSTLTNGNTFTQADIDTGRLSYRHNGSETPNNKDSFFYSVSDGTTSLSRIFDFNVTPVNDAPVLLTPNASFEVPGDVPSVTEISSGLLQVTDVDNAPNQIVYTLVAAPNSSFGQLKLNGTTLVSGQTFTQADIDAGGVSYVSSGGGSSDSFQLSISDGGPGGTLPTEFVNIFFTYP